jgi:uncharacterized protein YggE
MADAANLQEHCGHYYPMQRSSGMRSFAMAVLLGLAAPMATPCWARDKDVLVPSVTVTGSGKVFAKPDMAQVQLGVVTQAPQAGKALKENNEAMARLLSALDARGIPKQDVQTTNFSVMPQHHRSPQGDQPEIVGYQVSNEVHVKVRKLDLLGPLLDQVVEQGANHIQGISFSVAEPGPLLDQARQKAMEDARRKARLYANASGETLGRVLLIQEETPHMPRPLTLGLARAAAAVPIAEGEQGFGASITVTYALTAGASPAK